MLKLINLLVISIALSSCGTAPEEELPDQVAFSEIVGIIYDGVSSRLQNSGNYQPISGKVALVFQGTDAGGTFKFSYSRFSEPSLCAYMQNCECTGVLTGSYLKTADPTSSAIPDTSNDVYDPMAQDGGSTTITPSPDPSITTSFVALTIDYQASSLSSTCPIQSNRTVKLQVHNDRTLVYTDLGKDLVLKPRQY